MDHNSNVLGGRIQIFEFFSVQVQVFMIETFNDLLFYQITKLFHVHYISCSFIRFACNLYDQFIVMAMIIWQSTFAKDLCISFIIPCRVKQAMGRIKMLFSEYCNFLTHSLKFNNSSQKNVYLVP